MAPQSPEAPQQETVLDVTEERVARTYAEALLGAAQGAEWDAVSDLNAIVTEVLDPHPAFIEPLRSAFLSHDERVSLIDRVFGGRVSPVVLNFLKVLSAHGRLGVLRTVADQAMRLYEQRNNNVRVAVRSAEPLSPVLINEIEAAVRQRMGKEPIVQARVDPELIAGLQVRVGDTVFDGSLKTAVERARRSIVDQTIARIEQDPDKFIGRIEDEG